MARQIGYAAQDYITRYEEMKSSRAAFEDSWQEIADNELGRREFTDSGVTPGRRRMQKIYDTTALTSLNLLGSALHSLLTNSSIRWFALKPEQEELMQDREVELWFEYAENEMLRAFNKPEARFTPQIHEVYFDLAAFGTSCMFIADEPGFGPFFSSRPLAEIFVGENERGVIDHVYRKFSLSARQAVQMWGKEKAAHAMNLVKNQQSDQRIEYLHCVLPNPDAAFGRINTDGMPWRSVYVSIEEKKIMSKGGYHEMPYMVARWSKDSGEVFGRGPGLTALADAKMLNEQVKITLKAAQRAVDPPILVSDDGVISQLETHPGGVITYRDDLTGRDPVRPLITGSNFTVGVEMINRTQQNVRNAFHYQLLEIFNDPRATATQVVEVASQTQRLLSPTIGRMQVELLEPLIERVFGILLRSGRLPPPPEVLQGREIAVEYVSPVARAQKQSDATAIIDTVATTMEMAQVFPEMADLFNPDEVARAIAEAKAAPPSILRSREEVAAVREMRQEEQAKAMQAQQQAQQLDQANTAADVMQKVGPMMQQQGGGQGA